MVLYFKSLELHNFGSYASAKFDLRALALTGNIISLKELLENPTFLPEEGERLRFGR